MRHNHHPSGDSHWTRRHPEWREPWTKLAPEQLAELRAQADAGVTPAELARRFRVSRTSVWRYVSRGTRETVETGEA